MSFQAPSLQPSAEPPSACVSTIASINNSCGGNNASAMSSMAPPPPAKPALQEPQLPRSAASGNKSEFSYFQLLHRFIWCCTSNTRLDPLDETLGSFFNEKEIPVFHHKRFFLN